MMSDFLCRMNLCTTVTESDVARGKNALKASLVGQLNGTPCVWLVHTHTHTFKFIGITDSCNCLMHRNNPNL